MGGRSTGWSTKSDVAGDNYLISPRGRKLASLIAAGRWLSTFGAASVASGAEGQAAIDTHGQCREPRRSDETSRLAAAVLQVGSGGMAAAAGGRKGAQVDG